MYSKVTESETSSNGRHHRWGGFCLISSEPFDFIRGKSASMAASVVSPVTIWTVNRKPPLRAMRAYISSSTTSHPAPHNVSRHPSSSRLYPRTNRRENSEKWGDEMDARVLRTNGGSMSSSAKFTTSSNRLSTLLDLRLRLSLSSSSRLSRSLRDA